MPQDKYPPLAPPIQRALDLLQACGQDGALQALGPRELALLALACENARRLADACAAEKRPGSREAERFGAHEALRASVDSLLAKLGYYTLSMEYHRSVNSREHDFLIGVHTLETLYVRHRTDRLAVHLFRDISFLYDVKTGQSARENIAVEAVPLLILRAAARYGARALLLYAESPGDGRQPSARNGFVVDIRELRQARRVVIPPRSDYSPRLLELIEQGCLEAFGQPQEGVSRTHTSGTNTPFILIAKGDPAVHFGIDSYIRALTTATPHREPSTAPALQASGF
jgi:hypothetical protein